MIRHTIAASAFLALASTASAQIFYSTGFEPPLYTVGSSVNGVDGWANGSSSGAGFSVSDTIAASGSQSLKSDNSSLTSFYSVRHGLGTWTAASGDFLQVSVDLYVDSSTANNRLYGMILGSSPTSTLGGTVLGLTIGGDGSVRAGTTWSNTYTDTGLLGQAAPGSFLDRWLNITLTYDPTTAIKTASISGFGDGSVFSIAPTTAGSAPQNLNFSSDYFGPLSAANVGIGYFDNLVIAVPAPGALALLGLAGLSAARRRRA